MIWALGSGPLAPFYLFRYSTQSIFLITIINIVSDRALSNRALSVHETQAAFKLISCLPTWNHYNGFHSVLWL